MKSTFTFAFDCRVSRLIEVRLRRERKGRREGRWEVKMAKGSRRGVREKIGRRERYSEISVQWSLCKAATSLLQPPTSGHL